MIEAFDTGETSEVDDLVHEAYIDHQGLGNGPIHGPSGFCQVVEVARGGYEYLDVKALDLIEQADRVAARIEWCGVGAAGEVKRRETIDIIRIVDGKALEHGGA